MKGAPPSPEAADHAFKGGGPSNTKGDTPRGRGRGSFDKMPTHKKSKVNTKTPDKDSKFRCWSCHQYRHRADECRNKQAQPRKQSHFKQLNEIREEMATLDAYSLLADQLEKHHLNN